MKRPSPVLVIGLDGASPDLVRRWTESGDLPALAGLIERGTFTPLRSTIPPISPAAWSTFMTGRNPAGHGVLGFRNLDVRRYELHEPDIISSQAVAGGTFWDFAGSHGASVGVFWVPVTYPPWTVNGVLISGYPTPTHGRSFGHPETLASQIPGLTENSAFFHSASPEAVREELLRLARERSEQAAAQIARGSFGLSVVVLGSTDRAQHDFWRHLDPASPVHDPAEAERLGSAILDVYRESDRGVARMLENVSRETSVLIVSDHGGGPAATRIVHLNAWLRQEGILRAGSGTARGSLITRTYQHLKVRFPAKERLFRRLPRALRSRLTAFDARSTLHLDAIDWASTKAYRFPLYPPFEGIAINRSGRQNEGCVTSEGYEPLREQLIGRLKRLIDTKTGNTIVRRAARREDVFAGEHLERFPDIIVEWEEGYEGGPEMEGHWVADVPVDRLRRLSGAHRMDGILIAAGPDIRRQAMIETPCIADIAPTVLYAMGLTPPRSMDGRILTELFEREYVEAHPVKRTEAMPADVPSPGAVFSDREQAEIAEQLRDLGYID